MSSDDLGSIFDPMFDPQAILRGTFDPQTILDVRDKLECPTFFPAQNGGRRARQRARGAIAAARVIALGVYASESLAFHRLLVVDIAHGICKALQRIPVLMAPLT